MRKHSLLKFSDEDEGSLAVQAPLSQEGEQLLAEAVGEPEGRPRRAKTTAAPRRTPQAHAPTGMAHGTCTSHTDAGHWQLPHDTAGQLSSAQATSGHLNSDRL